MLEINLTKFGYWTRFLGWFTLISGVLTCFTVVGIIPGVICILLGNKLLKISKQCYYASHDPVNYVPNVIDESVGLFRAVGIVMMVELALIALSFTIFYSAIMSAILSL